MARHSDQYRHYVFGPDALEDSFPYIDKLALTFTNLNFSFLRSDQWGPFVRRLNPLFVGLRGGEATVGAQFIFQGRLRRDRSAEHSLSGVRGLLQLTLNPTRILQGLGPTRNLQQFERFCSDPHLQLNRAWGESHLRNARRQTFNGADNFLTDENLGLSGLGPEFIDRTVLIIRAIRLHIEEQILATISNDAENLGIEPVAGFSGVFDTSHWSVGQCEFYWEKRVTDAVDKVRRSIPAFESVSLTSWTMPFVEGSLTPNLNVGDENVHADRRGWDGNTRYVAARLGHEKIRAKLYAKTPDIVRFEIAYDTSVKAIEQHALADFASRDRTEEDLHRLLTRTSEQARDRAVRFWRQFWEAENERLSSMRDTHYELIAGIYTACADTSFSPSTVLSILMERRSIARQRGLADICRRLTEAGIIHRHRDQQNNRAIVLRLTPRFYALVEYLSEVLGPEIPERTSLADPEGDVALPRRRRIVFDPFR